MQFDPQKTYAVLTGDIVGSSQLGPAERKALPDLLRRAAGELRDFRTAAIPLDIDIYAGDSWQLLLTDPGLALRAAVFMRAFLRDRAEELGCELDSRVVVALGSIDFVPANRVSEGDGEAFRLSGRTLQEIAPTQRMRFVIAGVPNSPVWDAVFALIDGIITHCWTAMQARAVSGVSRDWSRSQTATLWPKPISPSAVFAHLRKACWHAISQTISQFESTDWSRER
ncbi:MAG: hypothetical protein NTY19_08035 [Planctomycetota bacterium]|nr:hypothetical protein [Planctomycetota bacterium]